MGSRLTLTPPGEQVIHQPALDLAELFQRGLLGADAGIVGVVESRRPRKGELHELSCASFLRALRVSGYPHPTGEQVVHQPTLDLAQLGQLCLLDADAGVVGVKENGDVALLLNWGNWEHNRF